MKIPTVVFKTKSWMLTFAQKEFENIGFETIFLDNEYFKIKINDEKELEKLIEFTFYYSRSVENIFFDIFSFENLGEIEKLDLSFIKKNLSFEVDSHNENRNDEEKIIGQKILESNPNLRVDLKTPDLTFKILKIDLKKHILLDLIGFDLSKREYKININSNSINSLVCNYLFYLLEMEKEKQLNIIDPACSLGDLIIEASLFNPRIALNIRKKNTMTFSKIFKIIPMPKQESKSKNKIIGVVQNNKIFKQLKENIAFSSQKIKTSQYEFDFLDVKFKRNQVDYLICYVPSFKIKEEENEFMKELFYQAEFITKKKTGIISKKQLDDKTFKKFKLWAKVKKEILVGEQKLYLYVIIK